MFANELLPKMHNNCCFTRKFLKKIKECSPFTFLIDLLTHYFIPKQFFVQLLKYLIIAIKKIKSWLISNKGQIIILQNIYKLHQ